MKGADRTADYFRSRAWNRIRTDYLQDHELCEICRRERRLVLATDVYRISRKRQLIAVCKTHLDKLIRKSRRYSFDQEGNLIINGKAES